MFILLPINLSSPQPCDVNSLFLNWELMKSFIFTTWDLDEDGFPGIWESSSLVLRSSLLFFSYVSSCCCRCCYWSSIVSLVMLISYEKQMMVMVELCQRLFTTQQLCQHWRRCRAMKGPFGIFVDIDNNARKSDVTLYLR